VCSLAAYQAEHPTNPGFATIGDALWWGIATLTTVGYGDIVPETAAGRLAGIAIMFTGIAVLGLLAGSLASLFDVDEPDEDTQQRTARATDELAPRARRADGAPRPDAGARGTARRAPRARAPRCRRAARHLAPLSRVRSMSTVSVLPDLRKPSVSDRQIAFVPS
jgi:hypothetical protein